MPERGCGGQVSHFDRMGPIPVGLETDRNVEIWEHTAGMLKFGSIQRNLGAIWEHTAKFGSNLGVYSVCVFEAVGEHEAGRQLRYLREGEKGLLERGTTTPFLLDTE